MARKQSGIKRYFLCIAVIQQHQLLFLKLELANDICVFSVTGDRKTFYLSSSINFTAVSNRPRSFFVLSVFFKYPKKTSVVLFVNSKISIDNDKNYARCFTYFS